ncbi:MAG: hypothetical protein LBK26_04125 [Rickettsiales bacterium]|jgi:hypothetical protein|nr:hypothetical protein [Rickettsiales bacterium]
MFTKFATYKEVREMVENNLQNDIAIDFIMKYIFETRKRIKNLLKELESLKDPEKID